MTTKKQHFKLKFKIGKTSMRETVTAITVKQAIELLRGKYLDSEDIRLDFIVSEESMQDLIRLYGDCSFIRS